MDKQAIQEAISAVYSAVEALETLVQGADEATETGEEGAMPSDSRAMLAWAMAGGM